MPLQKCSHSWVESVHPARLVIKCYDTGVIVNNIEDCGKEHLSIAMGRSGWQWMCVPVYDVYLYSSLVCTLKLIPNYE